MKVIILGTAAGGGFPQWNCACPRCADRSLPSRTQDGLAISADGNNWYLVNASPDIRAQLMATPVLRAGPGLRQTPLRGVLLTDAELDHTLGLLMLREGAGLAVHAPHAVLTALQEDFPVRELVSLYGAWSWSEVRADQWIGDLRVRTFAVSNKTPKYCGVSRGGPWVIAYRFDDPATGGSLVYAPCLATWPEGFDEFVADASYVLLDGTFYDGEELASCIGDSGVQEGAQGLMGHLPVGSSLERISKLRSVQLATRWAYTHLNNTNPLLDAASPQAAAVCAAGVETPLDGTVLEV